MNDHDRCEAANKSLLKVVWSQTVCNDVCYVRLGYKPDGNFRLTLTDLEDDVQLKIAMFLRAGTMLHTAATIFAVACDF